ncbi:MAG: hypothetical protein M3288_00990 [Thermoproteota archaeon]|jgi:hypothetical protein|nr:hypothetical protein [Thermoproteota archaeon]MDQ5875395.1 hypothetical protein [Thermoproteota archaeon]
MILYKAGQAYKVLTGDHALFYKTKMQIEQQQQLQMTSTKEELKIVKYQRPDSSTWTTSSAKQEGIRTDVQQLVIQRPFR